MTEVKPLQDMDDVTRLGHRFIDCLIGYEVNNPLIILSLFMVIRTFLKKFRKEEDHDRACDIVKDLIKKLQEELILFETYKQQETNND